MAHHKSAIKRNKQSEARRMQNKAKESKVKTVIKTLRSAIEENKKDEAKKLLVTVQSLLSKLAKSPAMTKKTAARRTSNLASSVAKL